MQVDVFNIANFSSLIEAIGGGKLFGLGGVHVNFKRIGDLAIGLKHPVFLY